MAKLFWSSFKSMQINTYSTCSMTNWPVATMIRQLCEINITVMMILIQQIITYQVRGQPACSWKRWEKMFEETAKNSSKSVAATQLSIFHNFEVETLNILQKTGPAIHSLSRSSHTSCPVWKLELFQDYILCEPQNSVICGSLQQVELYI